MISTVLLPRATANRRGSTLTAALALVFLIFAVTTVALGRVAFIYTEIAHRHNMASALYLADAGLQKAAFQLTQDPKYLGESGTRLPTGTFDVKVQREGRGYAVTSTGHAASAMKRHPKKTIRAVVFVSGHSFRLSNWKENP